MVSRIRERQIRRLRPGRVGPTRANAEINFRNGGSAEGSLARRGGRSIPRKGWDPFFPPRLDPPTQHSQRPLKGMGPLLPIRAPALSQAILSEVLGRRPGRNGLSAVSEAQGQGLWTLAFASSWQTGHFASAIWKFLSAFALARASPKRGNGLSVVNWCVAQGLVFCAAAPFKALN